MSKMYFNIAWRNLVKNKLYSIINIGGLATGLSISMLILLYVAHEMSFDRFHKNANRIFFPVMNLKAGDKDITINRMSFESAPILKNADPGIEGYLRIKEIDDNGVIQNTASPEKKYTERNILLADSNFFTFFSFKLLNGNPENVLVRPFTMVISERTARKYFGTISPVGKVVKYDDQYNFEITAVVADPPSNSTIDYDFIGSMSSITRMSEEKPPTSDGKISVGNFKTFLLLRNGVDPKATAGIIQRLAGNEEGKFNKFNYSLNALVNFHTDYDSTASGKYRKVFPWIAALILFLALINYMSLATARSAIRSKEVGVRKVLGADRYKIIKQFYIESGLYAALAFILAVVMVVITRPAFYNLLQLEIDDTFLNGPYAFGIFAGLFIVTIIISGSYPAFVLSSFKPVKVLYGKLSKQRGGAYVRKFFTVLQFTISVTLIISSVIINMQLDFFRHTDTGMQRENIVMIPFQKNISKHYLAFKQSIQNINGIEDVSLAAAPMYGGIDMTAAQFQAKENILISEMYVDQRFFKMLAMRWKFAPVDEQQPAQKGQVVINEEAVSKLGLPPDPVGQQIVVGRDSVRVCGVLKNFNFASLHHKVEPLCLFVLKDTDSAWYSDNGDCLFAKIGPHTNIPGLITSIQKVYTGFDKQTPFEYRFVDEAFNALYSAEDRLAKIFNIFTFITILIACLGLFGLAAFTASQRTKEIGIRKVLGAQIFNIISLISVNFIKPVLLSIVIALPAGWLFMNKWLQDFAYRTPVNSWVFILAAAGVLLIAIATVSFHAIKAAIANPVKSLRTE